MQQSVFRSLLTSAALLTAGLIAILLLVMYRSTVLPIEEKSRAEAIILAEREVSLRLRAKEDSVLSFAAGLSRDPRVVGGLLAGDRELALSGIRTVTEDFSAISAYRSIRAQVIGADGVIYARSWDPAFFGERAPHPLAARVLQTREAAATFGIGNAGVGVIGFAPVMHEGRVLGLVSVTQGVGSVVRALREAGLEWTLLLSRAALQERFRGTIPATYEVSPEFDDEYLLAHREWFDGEAAEWVRRSRGAPVGTASEARLVDGYILIDMPALDKADQVIGRSVVRASAEVVSRDISQGRRSMYLLSLALAAAVTLVVGLLMLVVRRRLVMPMFEIVSTINDVISSGRFSGRVEVRRPDELGLLAENFNALLANVERALNEASAVIGGIAGGDFARRMKTDYRGDLASLRDGIEAAAIELQRSHHTMEQANLAKGQFLANMSHEIRTPINGVIGMLSLLEHTKMSAEQAEQVRLAQSSAGLLLGLVNDILDFSKIEAGKMNIEQRALDLHGLCRELAEVFSHAATAKGLKLRLDIAEGVPVWVQGDSLRLRQVLNNLVSNALKFTEHGEIRLLVAEREGKLLISVCDSGIGMTEETLGRLFQSFSQADNSTSRKYGGSGLGLKISRELALLMGGDVEVVSTLGQGSEFCLSLPCIPCAAPEGGAEGVPVQHNFVGKRVLVVEDNLINQKLAMKLLETFGLDARLANHGQVALEVLAQESFDLVLMDCQMPVMDGYTATRLMRQSDLRIPVVALTANASAEDRQRCISAGMNDFLTKPYTRASLEATLARWLD
ncbi:ATP-binding protein [Pseudothauera lacus]|uniref:Virulence sensor protein BvgS n=1 Tax=Pseudothauera lacus TaxID=2136175 RepID=A0A2T4IGH0_9RHOO|nr:ATP-binding protein [Pseudothauera lacus]PTD96872.1 hypothetical protein C8261_05530 [Pseudothauera lacus]